MEAMACPISGVVVSEKKSARISRPVEVGRGGARAAAPKRPECRAEAPQDPVSAGVGGGEHLF
jgi:hypothetical protein